MSGFEIMAVTPALYLVQGQQPDFNSGADYKKVEPHFAQIALAAFRCGHTGIIDLEFASPKVEPWLKTALTSLADAISSWRRGSSGGRIGFRLGAGQIKDFHWLFDAFKNQGLSNQLSIILFPDARQRFSACADKLLSKDIVRLKSLPSRLLFEVVSAEEAKHASDLQVDAIIAKGSEAGGLTSERTTLVLLQECIAQSKLPVLAEGGIGLHTAAASYAAGASGLVLGSQLLLSREANLPLEIKLKIRQMDGTETLLVGAETGQKFRLFGKPNSPLVESIASLGYPETKKQLLDIAQRESPSNWVFPLGQDVAFAAGLSDRFISVAGILDGIKDSVAEHIALAKQTKPLAPLSPLAKSHTMEYPIVQGAMTRVSDSADFALKVAEGGALPFLALALMRKNEVEALLSETKEKLSDKPWGVGILGFTPNQLRQEQLEVIHKYKPAYALIAGGRPDQAKELEEQGIKTYLHVPSPLLLASFIDMGSKRFIFEGRECGGHVGPRTSFVLWEAMIEELLKKLDGRVDASQYHVLFAGGIHDARSAAMVSAMAAALAHRGVKVGVLMGTAYLYTVEAVSTGAIVPKFQESAINCRETVLLETGPGHAIRCIESPYKATFDQRRKDLVGKQLGRDEIREELEAMNIGRLRIASKGLTRHLGDPADNGLSAKEELMSEMVGQANDKSKSENSTKLVKVSDDKQWDEGMYMIGQVASMHDHTCTIRELHQSVSQAGTDLLQSLELPYTPETVEDERVPAVQIDSPMASKDRSQAIAIIGMSCLLPKAKDLQTYWRNILEKVDTIEEVPIEHWDWRNYYDENPLAKDKIYSKWGGFLESIEFEATKYGIPPSSLTSIDPMQMLLLEVTDAALKDAGYDKRPFSRERTSVILANAGHGPITAFYSLRSMLGWKLSGLSDDAKAELEAMLPEWTEDSFPGYLGNVTAGRVANRFDLGGVNFSIDAACASSLAALHTAVANLRSGGSDLVLLSAVDTHNQPGDYLSFSKTHAFSSSGRCKTFDASADGIVISEGIAMLVLKRLSDAERDGDRIYAVIRGVGGSSDGRDLSLTAPRPAGQVKALLRAYEDAGISPASISLVEAHGTGTVAGDKAEVEALKQVFASHNARQHSCAIGSVKTMIGHTKATAGLASLIKVAKALHHKVLPATIGVKVPNPACHFEEGPFYINSETRPWLLDGTQDIRRAGVSAFGFGGTNFHAVVEEYTAAIPAVANDANEVRLPPAELFYFMGENKATILKLIDALLQKIESSDKQTLRSLASFQYLKSLELSNLKPNSSPSAGHLAIVTTSLSDLKDKLTRCQSELSQAENKERINDPRGIYFTERKQPRTGKLAFLFPGQGSQYINMLLDLVLDFSEARETFEQANKILDGSLSKPLSEYIYPSPTFSEEGAYNQKASLTNTLVAQSAVGVADVAMLSLLRSFGVVPEMVAGHSYGEYVALHAAGCYSFSDLLKVSRRRGELLSQTSGTGGGAMAAVSTGRSAVEPLLALWPKVSMANFNSPDQIVLSGEEAAIDKAVSDLKSRGIVAKRIAVSQAFHSPSMERVRPDLNAALAQLSWNAPKLPVFSNIDGQPYPQNMDELVKKLEEHLVKPVDFVSQIKNMFSQGADVFVEVGPTNVLTSLVDATLKGKGSHEYLAVSCDRQGRNGYLNLLHGLAQLCGFGVKVDLRRLYGEANSAVILRELQSRKDADKPKGKRLTYLVNSATVKRMDTKDSTTQAKSALVVSSALSKESPKNSSQVSSSVRAQSNPKATNVTNAPMVKNAQSAIPNASIASLRSNISGRNVEAVMLEFQKTMLAMTNNFLETQQNVMLAYLSGRGDVQVSNELLTSFDLPAQISSNAKTVELIQTETHAPALVSTSSALNQTEVAVAVSKHEADKLENNGDAPQSKTQELSGEFLANALLEIVSERTGYPVEMLDPTLDMEADLGIDSIKRVEILNNFRRILPESKQRELEAGIEELSGTKTLQGIIDWLKVDRPQSVQPDSSSAQEQAEETGNNGNGKHDDRTNVVLSQLPLVDGDNNGGNGHGNGDHGAGRELAAVSHLTVSTSRKEIYRNGNGDGAEHNVSESPNGESLTSKLRRAGVKIVPVQPLALSGLSAKFETNGDSSKNRLAIITKDNLGLWEALSQSLVSFGFLPVVLEHTPSAQEPTAQKTTSSKGCLHYSLNLTEEGQLSKFIESLESQQGKITNFFHLQGFKEPKSAIEADRDISLFSLLILGKVIAPLLRVQAEQTGAGLLALVSTDGAFGLTDEQDQSTLASSQAAIPGLVKTIAREYPEVQTKVVDVASGIKLKQEDLKDLSLKLIAELCAKDGYVEVGYRKKDRISLDVEPTQLIDRNGSSLSLEKDSVVLVTGGARGITADIAVELAQRYQPTLILVGRSELAAEEEEPSYRGIEGLRELKAAIIEKMKKEGLPVTIPAVEERYQNLIKQRELKNNLQRIESAGGKVEYHSLDVKDEAALVGLVKSTYEKYGKINALIHGAGIIEDAYLKDKSLVSFKRVYETKVRSAETLVKHLKLKELDFLIFFSSVVARSGNVGQADYVAANEVLNKLARSAQNKVRKRAVSMMWGPWKGGMAQQELESIFASYGWAMIDPAVGRKAFIDEIEMGGKQETEVLLVAQMKGSDNVKPHGPKLHNARVNSLEPGVTEFYFDLNSKRDAFLPDHAFEGIPVMPMTFALELMLEAIVSCFPGWHVHQVEKFEIPAGLVFDSPNKSLAVTVREIQRSDSQVRLRASLSSVGAKRKEHFQGAFELVPHPQVANVPDHISQQFSIEKEKLALGEPSTVPAVPELYANWLFHGPLFQKIEEIDLVGSGGVIGSVGVSKPASCFAASNGSGWEIDPVMLDSAMQLAGIWARHYLDITALPTGFRRLTKGALPETGPLRVRIFIAEKRSAMELRCDLAMYDAGGQLVLLMEDLAGVGTKALNRLSGSGQTSRVR